jgi:transposase InsO family protein
MVQAEFPPTQQTIQRLGIYYDEERKLLVCRGRFGFLKEDPSQCEPIYLPHQSRATLLYITGTHRSMHHANPSTVLGVLRRSVFFLHGKRTVFRALMANATTRCYECYKGVVKAYNKQPEPPLPHVRLTATRPFQHTGLDYFGPIAYKGKNGTAKKFYVALFGCLTYRAVHLEVTKDLTTERCLKAMRKFFASHGRPETILTDNASYFKAAQRSISLACGLSPIKWMWSTELAPWTAGTHERLVGLVKHCLRASVGSRKLKFEAWEVLIKEVARVVNCRPLCAMVDYEVSQPLRPIDFLEPGEGHPAIPNEFPDVDEKDPDFVPNKESSLANTLAQAFARNTQLLNAFQRTFHEQYLLALRERHETGYPAEASVPKVGDVVLIHEAEKQQLQWRLGIVEELLPGRDLLHRSAMVRVRNPETKSNYLLKRAIISLYPLERYSRVRTRSEAPSSDSGSETSSNEDHRNDPEDRQLFR